MAACSFPDNTNRKWYLPVVLRGRHSPGYSCRRNSVYPVIVHQVDGKIFIDFRREEEKKKKRIHLKPIYFLYLFFFSQLKVKL